MDTRKRIASMLFTLPLAILGAVLWYHVGGTVGVAVSAYCCVCIGIALALVAVDVNKLKEERKV